MNNEVEQDEKARDRVVVLAEFLQVGDEVIVQGSQDSRAYGAELPPDGTRAWMVGFTTRFKYVARKDRYHQEPGVYRCYGIAVFEWFDEHGKQHLQSMSAHDVIWADPSFDPQKTRRGTPNWGMVRDGVKVADLPDFPFYEGDVAEVVGGAGSFYHGKRVVVDRITYGWNDNMGTFGQVNNAKIIQIVSETDPGVSAIVEADSLKLVARGNYYHYEHDKSKLGFASLEEEVKFYRSLGLSVDVVNPAEGDYAWTLEQALDAIKRNQGAGISNPPRLFGADFEDKRHLHVYDFPTMRHLADRCRAATLEGFKDFKPSHALQQ